MNGHGRLVIKYRLTCTKNKLDSRMSPVGRAASPVRFSSVSSAMGTLDGRRSISDAGAAYLEAACSRPGVLPCQLEAHAAEKARAELQEAKRKVEAAAAAPAEAALADSDIGEAQTQTYRAMAPVAAAMAASAAVEATTGAPVEPSADEKHPSGMRNSRPAHTREVRAHHARNPNTHAAHTTLSQGVCQLGYWNKPNGPIKRFLRLLVDHMIYVRDSRPLEVDPKELRETGDRVLGAAVNRVRANM